MKKTVSTGLVGLISLAVAGNFLISLPLSADDGSDLLGTGIAVVFSFLTIILFYRTLTTLFSKDINSVSNSVKISLIAVYLLAEAVLIYTAVITLTEFSQFAASVMLPNVRTSVIFATFVLAAALISRKKTALSKTAAVLLFITAVLVIVIFIFSVPKMSLKYVLPMGKADIGDSLKTALSVYLKSFAAIFIPISVIGCRVKGMKSVIIGNSVGMSIIVLCMLNTLLVFGGGFASTLSYPYTSAVSTVAMGDMFSGMDGFLYVTVIFTCIIKTALVFYAIRVLASKISDVKKF